MRYIVALLFALVLFSVAPSASAQWYGGWGYGNYGGYGGYDSSWLANSYYQNSTPSYGRQGMWGYGYYEQQRLSLGVNDQYRPSALDSQLYGYPDRPRASSWLTQQLYGR
jgi:hypothetical protein